MGKGIQNIVLIVCLLFGQTEVQASRYSPEELPNISELKHNKNIAQEIATILSQPLTPKREALYKGVLWLIQFTDSIDVFLSVHQEYLTVLGELHQTNSSAQKRIIRELLINAIARISPYLSELLEDDMEDYMNYLFIAPIFLEVYPHAIWPGEFAQNHFFQDSIKSYKNDFKNAYKTHNYDELSDFMVDSGMLDLVAKLDRDRNTFNIKHNPYFDFHLKMQTLPWDRTIEDKDYADQHYCMTHVVLSLNHYGRTSIAIPSPWKQKIIDYHWEHFDNVRHKMDDFDLLAEFLYDLKVLDEDHDPRYHEGISHILKQQHYNGSWGAEDDLTSNDLYDVIHPTWTALSVLNMDLGTH
jgi:hypothetical protein